MLVGVAAAVCALASLVAAMGTAGLAGEAGPVLGLVMIVLGSLVLGRPLASAFVRVRPGWRLGAFGAVLLAGALACGLVLGPAPGGATAMVVLAMLGVCLVAAGSSGRVGAGARGGADLVDPKGVPGGSSDAQRPDLARAA
mgnify:CR=1 FL=1